MRTKIKTISERLLTKLSKVWQTLNILERNQQVGIRFTKNLKRDYIQGKLASYHSAQNHVSLPPVLYKRKYQNTKYEINNLALA
jgi:hypothetical protein